MDLNVHFNQISNSPLITADKIASIEEMFSVVQNMLKSEPITEEIYEYLLQKLDRASDHLSSLENTAISVNQFTQLYFEQLRNQAISLYGEVDDSYLYHKVHVLQDETKKLADIIGKNDYEKISCHIESIKQHISKILSKFSPALPERRTLINAKLILEKAEAYVRGEDFLDLAMTEWAHLEAEAVLEEIAEYLTANNRGALRLLIRQLSPLQKKLISAYLEPRDLLTSMLHDIEGSTDQNFSRFVS